MLSSVVTGLGVVGGLSLAAGGCAYAAMWPASQLFGETLIAPALPSELALTFDDGPNPAWTPRLLETLANHEVRASFFLLGSRAQAEPTLVRELAAAGHLIGNHSWNHPNLAIASARTIEDELSRTSKTLEEITGAPVRFFRPPFGARRPEVLRIARRLGMVPVLWNAMTSDWENPPVEAIVGHLARTIDRLTRRGRAANIVLHDGGHKERTAMRASSIAAAGQLVNSYKKTHKFVALDAWV